MAVDEERFAGILASLEAEQEAGTLTREKFREHYRQAEEALGDGFEKDEGLEAVLIFAESEDWLP